VKLVIDLHVMPLRNYEFSDNRLRSRDSVVSILPRLRVECFSVRISAGARKFLFPKHPDLFRGLLRLLLNDY